MLTLSTIELIKYITNNKELTLQKLVNHEKKTHAYIRNEIAKANLYLPDFWKIVIKNSLVHSNMAYVDFLSFMGHLSFQDYLPSQQERFRVIVVLSYFNSYVNLTQLYQHWNISLTTKKSDMKHLAIFLAPYGLTIERKPGAGIRIVGNVLKFRVLLVTIITRCIDVYDFQLEKRGANTPLESQLHDIFMDNVKTLIPSAQAYIQNFLLDYGNKINYYSKKFFLVYVILSLYPLSDATIEVEELRLKPLNLYLIPIRSENIAFNQVVSMIDFEPMMPFPYDARLDELIHRLFDEIQRNIKTHIHTKTEVMEELYGFTYRQYFFNYFNYEYEDKLVMNTSVRYPLLYHCMRHAVGEIESFLDTTFNDQQITSLTLIFSKWISKNRLYGRNTTKIVLVTNVGFERVSYFLEKLKDVIDYEHVATIDVNELHLLQDLVFDLILSFSNRMSSIIRKYGYQPIKLNYFIDNDDIIKLMEAGCSMARRRMLARSIIEEISNMDKEEQISYLKSYYEMLFL